MEKRKQHYIPRFYLKKFLDPSFTPPMTPWLWVYNHGETESFRKSPENVGYEPRFYDLRLKDGSISQDVENNFQKIESAAALVFKKIESGGEIDKCNRLSFAEFVWTLQMRNPYQRDNQNMATNKIARMALQIASEHPDYIRRILRESDPMQKDLSNEELSKTIDRIRSDEYKISIPQEYSIVQMAEMAEEMTHLVYNMKWSFLVAPNGLQFITSDNPVVIKDPFNQSRFYGDGYLSSMTIEVTFPLSPSICLLATWGGSESGLVVTSPNKLIEINNRICRYSYKSIFSSKKLKLAYDGKTLIFE